MEFFVIFIVFSSLILGPPIPSWNVFGQANDTDTQRENVIQDIPETSLDENNENNDELLIPESGSTGNNLGWTENQIIDDESNTSNESPDSQPDGDCLFDSSLPKCAPDENGNCPEGFGMNEDEQCFPYMIDVQKDTITTRMMKVESVFLMMSLATLDILGILITHPVIGKNMFVKTILN